MDKYIYVNGLKFAKDKNALLDSLFEQGGTASGIYKRKGNNQILFTDGQGIVHSHLTRNSRGDCFLGNAREQGKKVFMQVCLSEHMEKYFGIHEMGYNMQNEFVKNLAEKYL